VDLGRRAGVVGITPQRDGEGLVRWIATEEAAIVFRHVAPHRHPAAGFVQATRCNEDPDVPGRDDGSCWKTRTAHVVDAQWSSKPVPLRERDVEGAARVFDLDFTSSLR